MVDTENLPPSVRDAINTAPPPPAETQTIGEAYTSRRSSRGGGGGSSPSVGQLAQTGQLQEQIQKETKARQEAKAKQEAEAKARKQAQQQETAEQQALILSVAQAKVKASPKFEALRASRLAEAKQKIERPTQAKAILGEGYGTVTGEVRPFAPRKLPEEQARRKVIESLEQTGYKTEREGDIITAEKDGNTQYYKIDVVKKEFDKPTIEEYIRPEYRSYAYSGATSQQKKYRFTYTIQETELANLPSSAKAQPNQFGNIKNEPAIGRFLIKKGKELKGKAEASPFYPASTNTQEAVKKYLEREKQKIQPAVSLLQIGAKVAEKETRFIPELTQKYIAEPPKELSKFETAGLNLLNITQGGMPTQFLIAPGYKAVRGVARGGVQEIRERPREFILTAGAGAITGPALGAVGTISYVGKPILLAIGSAYTLSVGYRVAVAEEKPEQFGRILIGEVAPFYFGAKASGAVLKSASKRIARSEQRIEYRVKTDQLTKKELNFLRKRSEVITEQLDKAKLDFISKKEKLTKADIKEIGRSKSPKDLDVSIDIAKLSKKNLKTLVSLQEAGKIEGNFEVSLKPKVSENVGFSIKPKRAISATELEAREIINKKLISAYQRVQIKSRMAVEEGIRAKQKYMFSDKVEAEIRAKMAKTGKTAEQIVKEGEIGKKIKAFEEKTLKEQAKQQRREQKFKQQAGKNKAYKERGRTVPPSGDPFADFQAPRSRGAEALSQKFGRQGQSYKVEYAQEYLRGLSDKIEFKLPSLERLKVASVLRTLSKTKAIPLVFPKLRTDTKGIQKTQQSLKQVTRQRQLTRPVMALDIATSQATKEEQITTQFPISSVKVKTTQSIKQDVATEQRQEVELITKPELKTEQEREAGFKFPPFNQKPKPEQGRGYYDVKVRERGRDIKVNKRPLPYNKARNLGAEVVDNTPSAQFKLSKAMKKGEMKDDPIFYKQFKFRGQKDRYIELNTYRIDTPGEIQGITVKGWLAQRNKGRWL